MDNIELFTREYIAAALWSSTGNDERPLDDSYGPSDLAPETVAKMQEDCKTFFEANEENIGWNVAGAAHDFWLTRNRHGAGFWDGDWPEPEATRLTDAAHAFGGCDLYVGDDGRLYLV